MKILAMNFLRLGDLLMSSPICEDLKKRYSDSELHLAHFSEFQVAKEVMPQVDVWHSFSRKKVQASCGDGERSFLEGPQIIYDFFEELNQENFDLVINLSHTRFSALAMSLVDSKDKWGVFLSGDRAQYSSKCFLEMDLGDVSQKHYLDWYRKGFGFESQEAEWRFGQEKILSEGTDVSEGRAKYVFQVVSSDPKKAWSEESWRRLFSEIRRRDPFADLEVLCAPNEEALLKEFALNSQVRLNPCSLNQAFEKISSADFFVTLDTSTKHLANGTKAQVIELCLGSASFRKQGIYKSGSLILAPRTQCFPCEHKQNCTKVVRECAQDIEVEDVLAALSYSKSGVLEPVSCSVFQTQTKNKWAIEEIKTEQRSENFENERRPRESHSEA